MSETIGAMYLDDIRHRFDRLKELVDRAVVQVDDRAFFTQLGTEENSIALILKHLAGNMRSRWQDWMSGDGERPDRHRDDEFVLQETDTRAQIMARWEAGWGYLRAALEPLTAADLERTITIRSQPHTMIQALNRQLSHYAYHVGQVVFLAKHLAGDWQWLSIPPGQSEQFNAARRQSDRAQDRGRNP